ncbi:phosphatidylserine decarboxylase-like protein [Cubamyces sp. BRFM 1775]|nr:phosphatidylserine decarboxylase-like protein [Cubamyces sp. BRFM 1775]
MEGYRFPNAHGGGPIERQPYGWLSRDGGVVRKWLDDMIAFVQHPLRMNAALHPVILEFKAFIENDPAIYMGFHQMFEQVPYKPPFNKDPSGKSQVRSYMMMLRLFDHVIRTAPGYELGDYVGFPINAILLWPMATPAGMAMFMRQDVNDHFKKMFDVWSAFLTSEASRYVLNDQESGWFGPSASKAMPDFAETYICDPSAPYHGYSSWDDFFTRRFRPGVRPVVYPTADDIIISACESKVYRLAHGVKETDRFWLKEQPYSLAHMLNYDDYTSHFVGGTVYQAFLAATKYHRWHSPVRGTIVRTVMVPGTYYAESPCEGFPHPDPVGANLSQSFITSTAARALIFIQAANPDIGLMCLIGVGMAEVSTCEITVKENDQVNKGDELGMFHFGGSTHCLLFRPQTKVTFSEGVIVDADIEVNAPIASVSVAEGVP